jgi:phosphoglycerate dehydrogenase-like enzyme
MSAGGGPATIWVPETTAAEHLALLPEGIEAKLIPPDEVPASLGAADILVPSFLRAHVLDVIPRFSRLNVIQTLSAGVDWILPAVPEGTLLCDASGVHDTSVSEWVVAVILAMERRLPLYVAQQAEARWHRASSEAGGNELAGRTVLIVGHGSIGRATEARLRPFGVRMLRVARTSRRGIRGADQLGDLVAGADFVVVLLPLTAETRGIISAEVIARMRPGALLVNAARGSIVDTAALTEACLAGRIRAALDVTDPEPLPAEHPLWGAPGVLITPHMAGTTTRFRQRVWRFVADQAARYVAGEPLRNVVRNGY